MTYPRADDPRDATDFVGAKGALLFGSRMLWLLRDDRPDLPFAGLWDLVGGGREGPETPRETLIREAREETGLDLEAAEWLWQRPFPAMGAPHRTGWFFVLQLPEHHAARITLGEEGQGWLLAQPADFVRHPQAVPALRDRVALWLSVLGHRPEAG
ncbi:NUDIX domain-containing protein [Rubellimicrobium sp. CFH 75288]|uniref:NUDIX domain-containing protein n=1 Tax=Rubellimicrobium sp. CFH 75288 TaxID=2697034 RepID=UPI0014127367|nr:NUDIX domain-containing protein [Rubellimicrobium sp. CFH 75288]NAZ36327.1 NUDIX domain-containing protein [Rubellimicrobium sp. CFH 75288]